MINLSSKTRTRVTRNVEVKLTGEEIRQLVNAYFVTSRGIEEPIPADATITVWVPGGAVDIDDDCPVTIEWTEESGHDE